MIRKIDILDNNHAAEVLELQRVSYRVEAEYIGTYDIPPLMESLEDLMVCGEAFFGYFEGETLAGAVSYKYENGVVDIHRMIVHPSFFRRGIAKKLVGHLQILHPGLKEMIVSTGAENIPAVQLYMRLGFNMVGESMYGKDLRVAHFKKERK